MEYPLEDCVVVFKKWKCRLVYGRYRHGHNICIRLEDVEDGQPVITATTNSDMELTDDLVMIKDWTENQGIVKVLQDAGILGESVDGFIYPTFVLLKKPVDFPEKKERQ